jgi:hypothetical protein
MPKGVARTVFFCKEDGCAALVYKPSQSAWSSMWCREHYNAYQRLMKKLKLDNPKPSHGQCAICLQIPGMGLCCDHDHSTGEFRGWLFPKCNRMLGAANDNITTMKRGMAYLQKVP